MYSLNRKLDLLEYENCHNRQRYDKHCWPIGLCLPWSRRWWLLEGHVTHCLIQVIDASAAWRWWWSKTNSTRRWRLTTSIDRRWRMKSSSWSRTAWWGGKASATGRRRGLETIALVRRWRVEAAHGGRWSNRYPLLCKSMTMGDFGLCCCRRPASLS